MKPPKPQKPLYTIKFHSSVKLSAKQKREFKRFLDQEIRPIAYRIHAFVAQQMVDEILTGKPAQFRALNRAAIKNIVGNPPPFDFDKKYPKEIDSLNFKQKP